MSADPVATARERPDDAPKIDEVKRRIILGLIRRGASRLVACSAASLHPTEFKRYMMRGEKQRSGEYRRFRDDVLVAEAMFEQELMGVIYEDATQNKNVRSAQYLLERRRRTRWQDRSGSRQEPTPTLPPPPPVLDNNAMLSLEDRMARIRALESAARERARLAAGAVEEVAVVDMAVE